MKIYQLQVLVHLHVHHKELIDVGILEFNNHIYYHVVKALMKVILMLC